MKKNLWKYTLALGFLPFILAIILGIYHTIIESWSLFDWILLYSVIYWPTYIIGIFLILLSVYLKRKV